MRRSTNFLVALAAAIITFGTLHLAIGPKHFGGRNHYRHAYGSYGDQHPCDNNSKEPKDNDPNTKSPDQGPSSK